MGKYCPFISSTDVGIVFEGVAHDTQEFFFDPSKPPGCHWIEVTGPRDRAIHHVMSQLLYRPEFSLGEVLYDVPDSDDVVKLAWWDRRAVAFYTIKPQGPCNQFTRVNSSAGMPTLDTAFTLPSLRRRGLGLAMLRDLVTTYKNCDVALSYPLSNAMWMVLKRYLEQNSDLRRKMWLVKGDCEEGNKTLIWYCLRKREQDH